jgi:uncharacterized protein YbjT (DUF2867 family)
MSEVVLFGATGSIGRASAAELVRRGHQVTGVSRGGGAAAEGVTPAAGDASVAADVARLAAGADLVISATGPRRDGSGGEAGRPPRPDHPGLLTAGGLLAGRLLGGLRRPGLQAPPDDAAR